MTKSCFLKSLINRKNQPHTFPQQVLVQQTPIIFCCYYKPPRSGPHEVRNCREAAVPERETKILKEGAHSDRGSPDQNERPISDLSNTLYFVPLVRVVVEILMIEIFFSKFFENFQKRPGRLGLKNIHFLLRHQQRCEQTSLEKIHIRDCQCFFQKFNLKLTRKILDPSKNRVLKLQTAISPKLFKSDKRFTELSKEEHQGFQIKF